MVPTRAELFMSPWALPFLPLLSHSQSRPFLTKSLHKTAVTAYRLNIWMEASGVISLTHPAEASTGTIRRRHPGRVVNS